MNSLSKIEISRENLLSNIEQIRQFIEKTQVDTQSNEQQKKASPQIAAVVKGNAYGHGVKEVVQIIEESVDYFQVDDLFELVEVRQYSSKPTLVFGFVAEDQLEDLVDLNGIPGVYDLKTVEILDKIAQKKNKIIDIHLKIDCDLGRQGILLEEAENFLKKIQTLKNVNLRAVYSHFSNIEDTSHLDHAQKQFDGLMKVKEIAKGLGFTEIDHHVSATSGILTAAEKNWGGGIVRFGIGLYGMWPSEDLQKKYHDQIILKPVMRWVTHVAQVKEVSANYPIGYGCTYVTSVQTKVAVIPQGYSDGYSRLFSNNSEVLIGGHRCMILGRIAMNMFVVNVSDLDEVKKEDEVVLLGKQGDEEITAEELASKTDTINYEITTKVWPKLERVIT